MSKKLEEIKNKLALEFAYKNGEGDVTPMWLHKADLLGSDEHAFIKGFDAAVELYKSGMLEELLKNENTKP